MTEEVKDEQEYGGTGSITGYQVEGRYMFTEPAMICGNALDQRWRALNFSKVPLYDGAQELEPGHYLRTPAGSVYRIHSLRQDRKREYRRHLICLRWPPGEIEPDAKVHPLHWYPRERKRARQLASVRGLPA